MFAGFPTADEDPKEAAVAVVFVAVRMVRPGARFYVITFVALRDPEPAYLCPLVGNAHFIGLGSEDGEE